jgi:hypothetical protein
MAIFFMLVLSLSAGAKAARGAVVNRRGRVARVVGSSLATAKIRVHRARHRLRQALDAACTFEVDERGVLVCEPRSSTSNASL